MTRRELINYSDSDPFCRLLCTHLTARQILRLRQKNQYWLITMVKVIVVYESKYGNTKRVAEIIIEGIREVQEGETALNQVKDVDLDKIAEYDVILIGSPNHYGGPTKGISEFIDKLEKLDLKGMHFAVFDTHLGKGFFGKAARKMEKRINEKVPGLKRIGPILSIAVQGSKGPIIEGELSKCKEFGKRIATQFRT